MQDDFKVKTPVFEGPLEVLLGMVEKRKLFINDIALSEVANDYISYVQSIQNEKGYPMAEVAQFILVASTLLLIKSKSLLPTLTLTEEEQHSVSDLELRLKIYQRLRTASETVAERFGKNILFAPLDRKNEVKVFAPDSETNVPVLFESIKNILKNLPKKEFIPQAVVQKVMSLEEMIGKLTERISSNLKMSFSKFTGEHKGHKVHIIVSFLAMLELVKNGIIQVKQNKDFGEIEMETGEVGVPRYN
jgi:segregation and condensation protein A